jgi:hypothetical protein
MLTTKVREGNGLRLLPIWANSGYNAPASTQGGSMNMPVFCCMTFRALPRSSLLSVITQRVSRPADVPAVVFGPLEGQ